MKCPVLADLIPLTWSLQICVPTALSSAIKCPVGADNIPQIVQYAERLVSIRL